MSIRVGSTGRLEGQLNETSKSVLTVNDTYTLDLSKSYNFTIETTDTNAKSINFSNVPTTSNLILSISVNLKYINAASIIHPTGTIWHGGTIPTFTVGKQYMLLYVSYDNGVTWLASNVGAW